MANEQDAVGGFFERVLVAEPAERADALLDRLRRADRGFGVLVDDNEVVGVVDRKRLESAAPGATAGSVAAWPLPVVRAETPLDDIVATVRAVGPDCPADLVGAIVFDDGAPIGFLSAGWLEALSGGPHIRGGQLGGPAGAPVGQLVFECWAHQESAAVAYYDPANPPRCSHGDLMTRRRIPQQLQEQILQRPAERSWLVTVENYDESVGLTPAEARTVHLGVGIADPTVTVYAALDDVLRKTMDTHPDVEVFELVVQATSDDFDFDFAGGQEQTLRVPREEASLGTVTWVLTPRHTGDCLLVAAVSYLGNFLTQLELTLPVGAGGKAELSLRGRAPDSVADLQRKNLGLVIRPAASGYDLLISGDMRGITQTPITAASLSYVVDDVRKALLEVVEMTDANGVPVFQTGIAIPEEFGTKALGVLAKAGALLFNQLFFPDTAPHDLKALGNWLRTNATKPGQQLDIEVMAQAVSIPWAMLYCGDTGDGAELSWDYFLGLSHQLNAFPLPPNVEERDVDITSQPQLSVGLNVSTTIDAQFGVTWIAEHQKWWAGNAARRQHLVLSPRSTKASVVAALDDAAVTDGIVYFLCHASSPGPGGNPLDAAMDIGQGGPVVLKDLKSVSPQQPFANRPLVFINACESGELDPRFYEGFVTYFVAKGARGVIGTECKVPVVVAIEFADRFFKRLLDGETVGETTLAVRRELLTQCGNPLGLVYGVHCDAGTRILPALPAAAG